MFVWVCRLPAAAFPRMTGTGRSKGRTDARNGGDLLRTTGLPRREEVVNINSFVSELSLLMLAAYEL